MKGFLKFILLTIGILVAGIVFILAVCAYGEPAAETMSEECSDGSTHFNLQGVKK